MTELPWERHLRIEAESQKRIAELEVENKELREALDFYSDGWGYHRVNELEDLLGKWKTEAHEKESERRRLHEALDKYGEHLKTCVWVPCTCGLVEALSSTHWNEEVWDKAEAEDERHASMSGPEAVDG